MSKYLPLALAAIAPVSLAARARTHAETSDPDGPLNRVQPAGSQDEEQLRRLLSVNDDKPGGDGVPGHA